MIPDDDPMLVDTIPAIESAGAIIDPPPTQPAEPEPEHEEDPITEIFPRAKAKGKAKAKPRMRPCANAKKAQRKAKATPKAAPAPMVEVEAEATPQPKAKAGPKAKPKAKATPKAEPKAKARPEAKPAPTGEEMPKQMPLQDLSALLCSWCGTWQPYSKCRIQGKGDQAAAAEGGVASRAGEIKACLVENGEFFVVLRPAKVLGRISASSGAYRFEGPLKLSDPARLELAVAWYWVEGDIVVLEK